MFRMPLCLSWNCEWFMCSTWFYVMNNIGLILHYDIPHRRTMYDIGYMYVSTFLRMFQTTGNILNFCEVGLKISGIAPIKTSPAIIYDSVLITSVTVSMAERHTVIFLGTSQGFIKKVNFILLILYNLIV